MSAEKTHWRTKMKTKYLNGDELPEKGIVVKIEKITDTMIYSQSEKEKTEHTLIHFKKTEGLVDKPMILTNTKSRQLSNVTGSPFVEDWVGKVITIFPRMERHFGTDFQVINIKAGKIEKKKLTASGVTFEKAKGALESGKTTIDAIQKHYDVTPGALKALQAIEPKK